MVFWWQVTGVIAMAYYRCGYHIFILSDIGVFVITNKVKDIGRITVLIFRCLSSSIKVSTNGRFLEKYAIELSTTQIFSKRLPNSVILMAEYRHPSGD